MGEMVEFRITSNLDALRGQIIEANFDEVQAWLTTNLEPYRNMVVTEDEVPTAKTYRANIRKVADRIDQSRKEAKAAALQAYSAFEAKCKTLTGLCGEAATALDDQIKAYETREREDKISGLRAYYEDFPDDVRHYVSWERVFNPAWGNKGYSIVTARSDIDAAMSGAEKDVSMIRSIGKENTAYLLDYYKTHDLRSVLEKNAALISEQEAETRRAEEMQKRRESSMQATVTRSAPPVLPEPAAPTVDSETVTVDFRVTCTRAQLAGLRDYLVQSGIKYGKVQ